MRLTVGRGQAESMGLVRPDGSPGAGRMIQRIDGLASIRLDLTRLPIEFYDGAHFVHNHL